MLRLDKNELHTTKFPDFSPRIEIPWHFQVFQVAGHIQVNQGYISGRGGFKLHNFVIIWDTSTKFGQLLLFETLFQLIFKKNETGWSLFYL